MVGYDFGMSPRDPCLQAAALRLAAERVERGEAVAPELADALRERHARHPEDLAVIEALKALSRSGWPRRSIVAIARTRVRRMTATS